MKLAQCFYDLSLIGQRRDPDEGCLCAFAWPEQLSAPHFSIAGWKIKGLIAENLDPARYFVKTQRCTLAFFVRTVRRFLAAYFGGWPVVHGRDHARLTATPETSANWKISEPPTPLWNRLKWCKIPITRISAGGELECNV